MTETTPGQQQETETPFFWWELNNEQKLKRTIVTAPFAPGVLAAWDLFEGRPINVVGMLVASAAMLVMIALYWWRVRDERDAAAERSVLNAPAVDADARTGFLALAVAPFTMLALVPLHFVKLDMLNAASLAPFRDALDLGGLLGAPFAIATVALAAKALSRPSTTAARRAAFVAIVGVALAAGAWGLQFRNAHRLQAMRAIVTTRGAPQLIMPERWEQLATGETMIGTTTSWVSTVHAQALVAARVGSINDDVDQRGCEIFTQAWAKSVMKQNNMTNSPPRVIPLSRTTKGQPENEQH